MLLAGVTRALGEASCHSGSKPSSFPQLQSFGRVWRFMRGECASLALIEVVHETMRVKHIRRVQSAQRGDIAIIQH